MTRTTLISVRIGLSSMNHDHVIRNHAMEVAPSDIDALYMARLGNTGHVAPAELLDISSRSGGFGAQAEKVAYIDGEGWGASRGLAVLEFVVEDNVYNQRKLVVAGYVSGGQVTAGDGVPGDALFVPVRTYETETKSVSDHQGFLQVQSTVRNPAQILLNDHSIEGLATIRPKDIIENSIAHYALQQDNQLIGGGDDNVVGSASSVLSSAGLSYSNTKNNSPTHYAKALLESSMRTANDMSINNDHYSALSGISGTLNHSELNHNGNPFITDMRNALGQTFSAMSGFEGYSFNEIMYVYPNFAEVLNIVTADSNRFAVEDHRVNTNDFGSSNMGEIIATEILMLAQHLLIDNKLSLFSIDGTNSATAGVDFNGMNIDFFPGQMMPIAEGIEINMIGVVENIKQQIMNLFFNKFCGGYTFQRQIINFSADFVLFGESRVVVELNNDPSTRSERSFATFALNRYDPNVTSATTANTKSSAFYANLQNHFNFN